MPGKLFLGFLLFLIMILALGSGAFAEEDNEAKESGSSGWRLRAFNTRGSFGISLMELDFAGLNALLPHDDLHLDNHLFVRHWHAVIGAREGFRIGWSHVQTSQYQTAGTQKIEYNLTMNGVLLEWGTMPSREVDMGLGLVLGRGTTRLNLLLGDDDKLEDVLINPQTTSLRQPFYFLEPQLNMRFRLTSWANLHAHGAYTLSIGENKWYMDGVEVKGSRQPVDGWRVGIALGLGF